MKTLKDLNRDSLKKKYEGVSREDLIGMVERLELKVQHARSRTTDDYIRELIEDAIEAHIRSHHDGN